MKKIKVKIGDTYSCTEDNKKIKGKVILIKKTLITIKWEDGKETIEYNLDYLVKEEK